MSLARNLLSASVVQPAQSKSRGFVISAALAFDFSQILSRSSHAPVHGQAEDQEDDEHGDEQEEKELGDPDRRAGNAGEAEQAGYQADDQKD